MAQLDITGQNERRVQAALDQFLANIGQGFNAYLLRRSRIGEINRLNAMTDAELAKLGVTRERIPHYVFRDILHV